VRGLYATSQEPANLENGYWGVMAEPVMAIYRHWTERVNFDHTLLIRARHLRTDAAAASAHAAGAAHAPEPLHGAGDAGARDRRIGA